MTKLLNNRYQILKVLGGGGFSTTFLVEDTHMPSRRHCVLKQLKPVSVDPSIQTLVQERFQREAAILETLGDLSAQIPQLYAYFTEGHQYYLVQELIVGRTLTEVVKAQGALSEAAILDLLQSLLPIIDLVHQRGIIHRDIKPENIILRDQDHQPVLIDFGAVKETLGTMVNAQGAPISSVVIGTPEFMATEQARGFPTYASDLYSLGLTAIFLLTGKLPHELELDPQTSQLRWYSTVLEASPGLVAVLDQSINLVARDRYDSAATFLQALQSLTVPGQPPLESPLSPPATEIVLEGNSSAVLPTTLAEGTHAASGRLKTVGMVSAIAVVLAAVSFVAVQQLWPLISTQWSNQIDDVTTANQPSPAPPASPQPSPGRSPSPAPNQTSDASSSSAPQFAAIAYSIPTGTYGFSYRFTTQAAAEQRALQECNQRVAAQDCQALFWFQNACGSLAREPSGAYGWSWNDQIKVAEQEARQECSNFGKADCEILLTLCSDRIIQSR